MALTRTQVAQIIAVVKKDREFCNRVTSNFAVLGRDAGGVRNAALIPTGGELTDPSNPTINYLCVGIACSAMAVINAAIKRGQLPMLTMSQQATTHDGGHTGCEITMKDRSVYVIDWWQTLLVDNPVLFRGDEFMNNNFLAVWKLYGVQFRNFECFP